MRAPRAVRMFRALAIVLAAAGAMAQLPIAWKNWQYGAPISAPATDRTRFVNVTLPAGVMGHATRGLSDLRVIDGQGHEVPFTLTARLGGRTSDSREARLLEPSFVAGQYSQAMFDLGKSPRVHNVITLTIDGQDDLLTWVEVAVSDDHEHWRVVRERAPIYRLLQAGLEARTTISYPESVARYLRVRILDGSHAYTITRGDVLHEVITEAERVPSGVTLTSDASSGTSSVWTAGAPAVPMSEVRFTTEQKAFYRPVSVEVSDDGAKWTRVGAGEIYRTTEAGQPRESLSVEFPEVVSGHWRVTVHNRNDAPLADVRAELYMTPRHLIFKQEPGQEYRLIYGNTRVTASQYDLARLIDAEAVKSATPVVLGAEVANTAYANPAPWTEQHQSVMWIALGLAVIVIGALAVRSLVGSKPGSS